VLSGRSLGLQGGALQQLVAHVPSAQVHSSLTAFADFLLHRDHTDDSAIGVLS
jgi:hypothetical protein